MFPSFGLVYDFDGEGLELVDERTELAGVVEPGPVAFGVAGGDLDIPEGHARVEGGGFQQWEPGRQPLSWPWALS